MPIFAITLSSPASSALRYLAMLSSPLCGEVPGEAGGWGWATVAKARYGCTAVADRDQARDVVHIHRVTRDRDDVGGHAPARLQQVRMHGPDRERHRHWQPVLRRAPV